MISVRLTAKIKELIGEHLGIYTLNNGEQTPAILCSDKGDPRNDRTCDGLEVVVINVPVGKCPVYFKVWGDSNSTWQGDLEKAVEILEQSFGIEDIEHIVISEQPELRSCLKLTVNYQHTFTFDEDYLA